MNDGVTEKEIENAKEHVIGGFLLESWKVQSRVCPEMEEMKLFFKIIEAIDDVVSEIQSVKRENIHAHQQKKF